MKQNSTAIGESQVNPQMMGQVAPDVISPQGGQQMFQKMAKATLDKKGLDAVFKAIAEKYNGDFASRIKNPETVAQKIVQKRLQGREYGIDNVNDLYGARLIIKKKDFSKAVKDIEKVASALDFKINKNEDASHGTYEGYHVDMQDKNGGKFEVQLHTPHSEAESVINHSLRSMYGENPAPEVEKLRNKQAQIVKTLPNDKARQLSETVKQLGQQTQGPIPPQITAQLLQSQQQSQ